jgi:hypothetical protein
LKVILTQGRKVRNVLYSLGGATLSRGLREREREREREPEEFDGLCNFPT